MNLEIDKSIGFDFFRNSGKEVLFKTLSETPSNQIADVVRNDMTTFVSQALTQLANDRTCGGKAPAHIARLTGYLQGLSEMVELVSMVSTFETKTSQNGDRQLVMHVNPLGATPKPTKEPKGKPFPVIPTSRPVSGLEAAQARQR